MSTWGDESEEIEVREIASKGKHRMLMLNAAVHRQAIRKSLVPVQKGPGRPGVLPE